MIRALAAAAALALAPAPALAAGDVAAPPPAGSVASPPQDVSRIESCVRRNLPERSSRQAVRFRAVDRLGSARVSQAEILWHRFAGGPRALVRFLAPDELEGSALLLVQSEDRADIFLYLPELEGVRRVTGRKVAGALFGTDFSYEDVERLLGLYAEGGSRRLPDAEVDGREAWVLESRPSRGGESQYARVVSYVDRRTCVPLRIDLFERDDRLRKVLKVPRQRVERRGTGWLPTLVLMKDLVETTYTELIVDDVILDVELSHKLFEERELAHSARRKGGP